VRRGKGRGDGCRGGGLLGGRGSRRASRRGGRRVGGGGGRWVWLGMDGKGERESEFGVRREEEREGKR